MNLTDCQIMERVVAGQLELFEELVHRHRSAMLRAAVSKLQNRTLSEEAVQEAFLRAFSSRRSFDLRHSFRGWLWTILLNRCRTLARREFRRPDRAEGDRLDFSDCEPLFGDDALSGLLAIERQEQVSRFLDQIPETEADALRLRFFGGLKFEEIAQAMSCSLTAAKQRVRRGLENLAQAIRLVEDGRD